jgi:hypothetical protein
MARVYGGERHWMWRVFGPLERAFYLLAAVDPASEQGWAGYAAALPVFSAAGFALTYLWQRVQGFRPLNPAGLGPVPPHPAFNTAMSFTTNTSWQASGGETTLSYLTQMAALTVQTFVGAAAGLSVLVALAREPQMRRFLRTALEPHGYRLARRQVSLRGETVHLTPTEYRLLAIMVRHAGRVLTHRHLFKEVRGINAIRHPHYLRVYMGQLRQKLEQEPARPQYLLTELGVGYRLRAE